MGKIRIAIVGVGNCASSLLQGIQYYASGQVIEDEAGLGLMHLDLAGYRPGDIEVVAAFDVDARKVNRPLHEAIYAPPNCTQDIGARLLESPVVVQMGPVLDGVSEHMKDYPDDRRFVASDTPPVDVAKVLKESGAEILVNYLPVGSEQAARHYIEAALGLGISLVNCIPVLIVSNPEWGERFRQAGVPAVGDDVKAQVGATIVHRALARLFVERGVRIDRTYQLNTGGNTDFLNMLNYDRIKSKRISKTSAVQSILDRPLDWENIHIGPSDYVPWQNDNKVCFLRLEGRTFGGVPMNLELRLSVEDSPNSGGVGVDAIRCCKLARDRGVAGPLESVSSYLMKHPPRQVPDSEARIMVEDFIAGRRDV